MVVEKLSEHPGLKVFKQHGFTPIPLGENVSQVEGNCIFCGKEKHFFVNPIKKMFDCKICGKSGGFQTWLQLLVEHCKLNFKKQNAINLYRNRSINLDILKKAKIGFNPYNDTYILPVYSIDGKKLWDVKKYSLGDKLYSSSGCMSGLYNWQALEKATTVWLCEGEWDCLAALQYGVVAVGVPGAGTFKAEWAELFRDKKVFCVYDNDKAGQDGMLKVYNALNQIVKEIKFVSWPKSLKEGYDLRDYQKEHKNIKGILNFMSLIPDGVEDVQNVKDTEEYTGDGLTPEQIYDGYRKYLKIDDVSVLDVMYGTIISNRIEGDPLWMFIVAPPGAYKTELLISFSDAVNISTTTSLTPHSLVSGCSFAGGGDPSLIPRLNGKVLIIKDFTTILNLQQPIREEIFGILRDAYDGKTEKHFGNGVFRSYESKFGILAGVTPAIEIYLEGSSAMGERFLGFKTPLPKCINDRKAILRRAISNVGNEKLMRQELRDMAKTCLQYKYEKIPVIPVAIQEKILDLAQFVALMRGTVNRDKYTKEITHRSFSELGTRLAKQFVKLQLGITMFHRLDVSTDEQYKIIKKIGVDTVPGRLEDLVRTAYKSNKGKSFGPENFVESLGLPRQACQRVIEDLTMLGILQKHKLSSIKHEWFFKESILQLMEGAEVYA